MPTMILSDLLNKIPEPKETVSERERRYESEHAELNRALLAYNRSKSNRELRKIEEARVQTAAEEIGNLELTDEQAAARLIALKRSTKASADSEGAMREAEATLKELAIDFHQSVFLAHKAEEEHEISVISDAVRIAARWGDDGSGLVLTQVLRFSAPIQALNRLFPPRLPQGYEQKSGDWWAEFSADLLTKFGRLMECKERF
jgi:hypothetical protein